MFEPRAVPAQIVALGGAFCCARVRAALIMSVVKRANLVCSVEERANRSSPISPRCGPRPVCRLLGGVFLPISRA